MPACCPDGRAARRSGPRVARGTRRDTVRPGCDGPRKRAGLVEFASRSGDPAHPWGGVHAGSGSAKNSTIELMPMPRSVQSTEAPSAGRISSIGAKASLIDQQAHHDPLGVCREGNGRIVHRESGLHPPSNQIQSRLVDLGVAFGELLVGSDGTRR